MGRKAMRVPLDFDWPLRKTWSGYLMPERLEEDECPSCDGEGYTPEAAAIANTFYPHMIGYGRGADALAWHDKIGQDEVDNLLTHGRLRTWRDGAWRDDPRTADEVNERQRTGGALDGHDAINRMILVEFRCERLGIPYRCSECEGHGSVEKYPGQRVDAEAWEPAEPPTGEGWQMWENTSEGSPISPVFDSPDALAEWCSVHETTYGTTHRGTVDEWRAIVGGAPAMVQVSPGVMVM